MEKIHKIVLFICIILAFGTFLVPGIRVASDFPYAYPRAFSEKQFELPQTWRNFGSDGLGYPAIDGLWSWPMDVLVNFLGENGLHFWLITRLFFIIPVILISVIGMPKLLRYFGTSSSGQLTGTLFFLVNTYLLLLIDGGQLNLAVAYTLLPVAFYLFIDKNLLGFTLAFLAISIFDIRFIYLLSFLLASWIVFHSKQIIAFSKILLITSLVFLAWHSYWLIPRLITQQSGLPELYTQVSQLDFLNFTSLGHAISFLQPHWPQNIFGQISPLRPEFFLFPLIAFISVFFKSNKQKTSFWIFTSLLLIFLVKGNLPPLPQIYSWLFTHIPGFFLFRDSTKFFSLLAIPYSVLIGLSVTKITSRIKYFWVIPVLVLMIPVLTFVTQNSTGLFSFPRSLDKYLTLSKILSQDNTYGQVAWLPYFPPLGYTSISRPALDISVLSQKRPFMTGTVGTYETNNFIREAKYTGDLFRVTGIKYLVYSPPDIRRDPMKNDDLEYYSNFLKQLQEIPWLKQDISSPIPLFETAFPHNLFYVPQETIFVVGADDVYQSTKDISQNALIFVEEKSGISENIPLIPEAKIQLNRKKPIDLAASLIPSKKFIFPASQLRSDPDQSGWWKRQTEDFLKWRNFLQEKYQIDNLDFDYSGGWAVAEGSHKLTVKVTSLKPGQILLARVMSSSRGGKIIFSQDTDQLGEINTYLPVSTQVTVKLTGNADIPDQYFNYSRSEVAWHEVGTLSNSQDITISTTGDLNVVNSLVLISAEEWAKLNQLANNLLIQSKNNNPSSSSPQVEILKSFSSTHYRVKITGINQPTVLAFAQNFNPYWKANNISPLPLYSLINGFPVTSDGEYDVRYTPQKYILPGLALSSIILSLFLLLCIIINRHTPLNRLIK